MAWGRSAVFVIFILGKKVVVGLQSASKPGDTVVTSYRDHGHMLACGMAADGVMAELTGRAGLFAWQGRVDAYV